MSSNLTLSAMLTEIRRIAGSLVIFAVAFCVPERTMAAAIDAPAYYRAVLDRMRELREPAFLTYRTTVAAGEGSLALSRDDDGNAQLAVVGGASPSQAWNVAYRTSDGLAAIALPNGTGALSSLAIFDPTWRGAYAWLHRGLNASIATVTTDAASPQPGASAPPVLAVVTAINESRYDAGDGGRAQCPNGGPARRLLMHAKNDPLQHPLTDVLVDEDSLRVCAMHFHERIAAPSVTFDVDVDLRFGAVGAYYLAVGGTLKGAVRPYKRPGWFRIDTSFSYDDFDFPASIPDASFTVKRTAPP